jgi:hypothetical protein
MTLTMEQKKTKIIELLLGMTDDDLKDVEESIAIRREVLEEGNLKDSSLKMVNDLLTI